MLFPFNNQMLYITGITLNYLHSNTAICKENASVLLVTIEIWFIVALPVSCVHNMSHLKSLKIHKKYVHSRESRWRKKISIVSPMVRKACLFRIYWRLSSEGGHACENITTVILPRSCLKAIFGCKNYYV